MGQPSFGYDIKYKIERLEAAVRELNRKRDRRPPTIGDLQDVNGWGALNGYIFTKDTTTGRFRPVIPPPMVTFNPEGVLSVGSTGHFPIPANCKLFKVKARLKTAGSSTTTAILKKGATTLVTFTFTSGNNTPSISPSTISTTLVEDDYLWLDVTAAGTSAADLVVPVWAMASSPPS